MDLKIEIISLKSKNWREVFKNDLKEHLDSLDNWQGHKDYNSKLNLIEALKIKLEV